MKKILISGLIIIGFAVYLWMQRGDDTVVNPSVSPSPSVSASVSPTATPTGTANPSATPTASKTPTPAASAVKTFTVTGTSFSFLPNQIKVKKGDTVKIVFQNITGQHDWKIDEFNAQTSITQTGQSATVQFVANKTGTFEYYCSVGNHRALGMKGNLIVE